jgi:tetratricopeptide (TPR) repeat protein
MSIREVKPRPAGKSPNGSTPRDGERDAVRDMLAEEILSREAPPEIDRRVLLGPVTRRSPAKFILTLALAAGLVAGGLQATGLNPHWSAALLEFALLFAVLAGGSHIGALLVAAARHRRGNVEGALRVLNAMGRWTGRPDLFLPARAGALMRAGYLAEAVELMRARRRHLSGRALWEVEERLGVALTLVETDLAEAEKLLREAIAREPDRPELRANLGMCLYLQDRHPEAAAELEPIGDKIAGMEGARRATLFFALGDSLWHQAKHKEASPWLKLSREWVEIEREERIKSGEK